MSFTGDYLELQVKYTAIYGDRTIVFIQKGTFYEAYSTTTEGYNLEEISDVIKTTLTRAKSGTNTDANRKNPNMLGFPVIKIAKNLNFLTQAGYTVVIFDEINSFDENHKKTITREIAGIYSPGTFVADDKVTNHSNYLLSAYIVEEQQLKGAPSLLAIGLTLIDIVTANSIVHEFYSKSIDTNFGLDELFRMIQIFKPTEAIIYYHPLEINAKTILSVKTYLELDNIAQCHFCIYHSKKDTSKMELLREKMFKPANQNTYLTKIYNLEDKISLNNKRTALEIMNLDRKPYCVMSLIIMLRFLSTHNVNLLTNLSVPEIYIYDKHLILGNNAIEQLNVINSNNLQSYNKKIVCLYDVVNKTTTPMGRRLLKSSLSNPYSQENKFAINKRYEIIDEILKNDLAEKIIPELSNINDMERMHRKMAVGNIYPNEFYRLNKYYQSVLKLVGIIKDNQTIKGLIDNACIKKFYQYQTEYNRVFVIDELVKYNNTNYTDIDTSFLQKNINDTIDNLCNKINHILLTVNGIKEYFTQVIAQNMKNTKGIDKYVIVKHNDDGSYYFSITKTKEKILKNFLNKKKTISINLTDENEILKINVDEIEFKPLLKGKTKIFISSIDEQTSRLHRKREKMTVLMKNIFKEKMMNFYLTHIGTLHKICNFVAELDFLVSGALVAREYYYCRPLIADMEKNTNSYLKATELRHPIIERLCNNTEYIPNDIYLGAKNNKNGMLLYAINFSGKCLHPDTKIIMANGKIKTAKEIIKGDTLMGDDSTPRNVLATCRGKGLMYKIVPERGDPYIVNGPHILCLKSSGYKSVCWSNATQRYAAHWMENHKNCQKSFSIYKYGTKEKAYLEAKKFVENVNSDRGKVLNISVDEYMEKPQGWKKNYYTYHIGVDFAEQKIELDPYILGHWLGDGHSSGAEFTSADQEIIDYYVEYFKNKGLNVNLNERFSYRVTTNTKYGGAGRNWFLNMLRKYDLINNKHIPDEYLHNSRENRLKLFAGLIDSDGYTSKDVALEITQKSKRLSDDIAYLARSLGFFCSINEIVKTCTNSKNGPVKGKYYKLYIRGIDYSDIPLLMEYKRPKCPKLTMKSDHQISGFKIEPLGMGNYCGFELDGNHKFLLGDFTVTHNSSLMKSVGLSIILAQIGYYVPAKEFVYEPYMAIYARINANDNILKGLSSFVLEMTELDAILKRIETNAENTMVIGDEVCRGTEITSATAIVASTLVQLSEKNTSFIFSSHIHELSEIEEIKNLKNLRFYHLNVNIDKENDALIFERKLVPGSGISIYGVMVAKHMIKNAKFINTAEIIKNRLLKSDISDFPEKQSNYNSKLVVTKCTICKYQPTQTNDKELETHHINFQKNCCKDGKIKDKMYLSKNGLYNLVILCRKCHNKVHDGNIIINSYIETTKGPKLDYKIKSVN